MVLHVFNTNNSDITKLHGRIVPYTWFRVHDAADWPDRRLLHFQYRQCVQMFLRFYSYGVSVDDVRQQMMSQTV